MDPQTEALLRLLGAGKGMPGTNTRGAGQFAMPPSGRIQMMGGRPAPTVTSNMLPQRSPMPSFPANNPAEGVDPTITGPQQVMDASQQMKSKIQQTTPGLGGPMGSNTYTLNPKMPGLSDTADSFPTSNDRMNPLRMQLDQARLGDREKFNAAVKQQMQNRPGNYSMNPSIGQSSPMADVLPMDKGMEVPKPFSGDEISKAVSNFKQQNKGWANRTDAVSTHMRIQQMYQYPGLQKQLAEQTKEFNLAKKDINQWANNQALNSVKTGQGYLDFTDWMQERGLSRNTKTESDYLKFLAQQKLSEVQQKGLPQFYNELRTELLQTKSIVDKVHQDLIKYSGE